MPKVQCTDCGRDLGLQQLETKTVARTNGFDTHYRCPFCRTDLGDISEKIITSSD